jgi:hypothetical protein
MNPFSDEYTIREIEEYGLKAYCNNGIEIETRVLEGRCDEYLNKAFFTGCINAPIMSIDGEIWMSLTPMEIQSHFVAIKRARGVVGTGGLGMGYFTLAAAKKADVIKVDVYEQDERVVEFFKENFSNREGYEKINIIVGNIYETLKDKKYDFFFMDIYKDMELSEEVFKDRRNILKSNNVKVYQWWGEEKVILQALCNNYIKAKDIDLNYVILFQQWVESGKDSLYNELFDNKMVCNALFELKILKRMR